MKVLTGVSQFTTVTKFNGVLPEMPAVGRQQRRRPHARSPATSTRSRGQPGRASGDDTYWTGKGLGRAARIAEIADQLGHTAVRDRALDAIRTRLTDWFTASPGETERVVLLQPDVGHPDRLPGVVRLRQRAQRPPLPLRLLRRRRRDARQVRPGLGRQQRRTAAWSTCSSATPTTTTATDTRFPFLRDFDIYAGHDWASGHGAFGAGNNQESSSEGMNFANALIQWGQATGNTAVRDAGHLPLHHAGRGDPGVLVRRRRPELPGRVRAHHGRHGLGRRRLVRHLVQRRAGDDPGHQHAADHRRPPVPRLQPGVRHDQLRRAGHATTAARRRSGRTSSGSSRRSATARRRWRNFRANSGLHPARRARARRTRSTGSATSPRSARRHHGHREPPAGDGVHQERRPDLRGVEHHRLARSP